MGIIEGSTARETGAELRRQRWEVRALDLEQAAKICGCSIVEFSRAERGMHGPHDPSPGELMFKLRTGYSPPDWIAEEMCDDVWDGLTRNEDATP